MKKIKIPLILKKINTIFEKNNFEVYLVGGAVRDVLMKKKPSDWDLATNATPQQVTRIFHKVIPTGIEHGTVTIHFMKKEFEVTTFRTESDYSDGRHPDNVEYTGKIEEDLSRRDFTMNAIAASLKDGKIIDPFSGKKDIRKKIIRTVGNPHERFSEDGLRPIRAIRFAAKLGFSIEKETLDAISKPEILEITKKVSIERFRDEFVKLLESKKPSIGLKLFEQTGIMKIFLPEFLTGRNCIQNDIRNYHIFDVLDHNYYTCDGAPKEKINVRIAALLHDIGKPASKQIEQTPNGEIYTFYNHEQYSEKIAREILFRLKFSNATIENVCHLIINHMFHYESEWSEAAIRRFIMKVSFENIEDLLDLRIADMYGKYNKNVRIHDSKACKLLIELKKRIEKVQLENSALNLKDLSINGNDLIKIGIPAGKEIGKILNKLLETVVEDPSQNKKEKLLEIAKKIAEK